MSKEISKWADEAMFESEAMPEGHNPKTDPPKVYLLQGTPDPLGSIAAFSAMYSGKVVRDKRDVTDDERIHHLEEMKKTKLKAPLEAVNLHWMIDGIHRGITHQVVRQRTAVFAQESLRFAVIEGVGDRVALPPSLAGTHEPTDEDLTIFMSDPSAFALHEKNQAQRWRTAWEFLMETNDEIYTYLVNDGMPQEDARGALPTNITTRMNYATNLRNFQEHAGMRLCTQAQFEWRAIWSGFVLEMARYCTGSHTGPCGFDHPDCDNWQWGEISNLFRPICYATGKCEFMADVDRKCSIKSRVMDFHSSGIPSIDWDNHRGQNPAHTLPIFPAEWLMNPSAAR